MTSSPLHSSIIPGLKFPTRYSTLEYVFAPQANGVYKNNSDTPDLVNQHAL